MTRQQTEKMKAYEENLPLLRYQTPAEPLPPARLEESNAA